MPAADRADVVRRAKELLGRTITGHGVTVRITEVEAYGGREDPASHAFTRTARSEIMYGPAYRLYVYRSYGIHFCANVVTGPAEIGAAVLLRSGEVVEGVDLARLRRSHPAKDVQLARGPGNLAQALGITLDDLDTDLLAAHPPEEGFAGVRLGPVRRTRPRIAAGPRVGVSKAADVPWRFWVAGDPTVSAYRRSPRAPAPALRFRPVSTEPTNEPTYDNVTLDPRANVYFDGACVSHTFFLADGTRKSAGVIFPASLTFGTAAPEVMELNAGACRIRLAGADEWTSYAAGESFSVPGDSSFDIEVTETLGYVCHYG